VAIGLFVLTLNVCSAQIWSATCKKISPIKYEDIILVEDSEVSSNLTLVGDRDVRINLSAPL
jgi:hypothetical protein